MLILEPSESLFPAMFSQGLATWRWSAQLSSATRTRRGGRVWGTLGRSGERAFSNREGHQDLGRERESEHIYTHCIKCVYIYICVLFHLHKKYKYIYIYTHSIYCIKYDNYVHYIYIYIQLIIRDYCQIVRSTIFGDLYGADPETSLMTLCGENAVLQNRFSSHRT